MLGEGQVRDQAGRDLGELPPRTGQIPHLRLGDFRLGGYPMEQGGAVCRRIRGEWVAHHGACCSTEAGGCWDMDTTSSVAPSASWSVLEMRFIRDRQKTHPIAFSVEERGARSDGPTVAAAAHSQHRHGDGEQRRPWIKKPHEGWRTPHTDQLFTLSTLIHSNSQKEKEAKRKRNGRRRLSSSLPTATANNGTKSKETARKTERIFMKQQDISIRLNNRTFLNGLDKSAKSICRGLFNMSCLSRIEMSCFVRYFSLWGGGTGHGGTTQYGHERTG